MINAPPNGQPPRRPRRASRPLVLLAIVVVCQAAIFGGYQFVEHALIAPRVSRGTIDIVAIIRGVAPSL